MVQMKYSCARTTAHENNIIKVSLIMFANLQAEDYDEALLKEVVKKVVEDAVTHRSEMQ